MKLFRTFFRTLTPLFDVDPGGGSGSASVPSAPVTEMPPAAPLSIGEIWERDNRETEPAPVQQPVVEPAQPMETVQPPVVETPAPERILGKYENTGELVKAYQNLQGTYTKDHQALLDAQKVIEAERAAKADLEAKIQALNQPKQPPAQPTEDEFDVLDNEAYAQKFYEDPKGFTKKVEDRAFAKAEKAFNERLAQIEGKLNPVIERDQTQQHVQLWEEAATSFMRETPDSAQFVEGMRQYITENNLSGSKNPEKVFKDAYFHAKGLGAQSIEEKAATMKGEYEAKIQEYEAKLQANKEEIIKEYLAGVRTTQNTIPPTITGNSSSNAVATPQPQAKTIRDATRMAADRIFGG